MRRYGQLHPETIVEAAATMARASGLHAIGVAPLAALLAVPRRAVQRVFPVTEELVAAAFVAVVAAELAEVKRVVSVYSSPTWQMRALLDTLAEPVRVEVDSVWLESWSLGFRNRHLAAAVRQQEGQWHGYVASLVQRGVESGDFLQVDPDVVAAQLLAMIDGVNAYSLVGYRSDLDRLAMLYSAAQAHLGPALEINMRREKG